MVQENQVGLILLLVYPDDANLLGDNTGTRKKIIGTLIYASRGVGLLRSPRNTLYPQKVGTNFADYLRSLGQHSSLED
jgi:hypothetical protein